MKEYHVSYRRDQSVVVRASSHEHTFVLFKGEGLKKPVPCLVLKNNEGEPVGTFLLDQIIGWRIQ